MAEPIGPIRDNLRSRLDPLLGIPRRERNPGNVTLRYRVDSEIPPVVPLRLKVEINTREHFEVFGSVAFPFGVRSPWFAGEAEVRTYTLEELLATKLRALYQRRKGRDLFDLWIGLQRRGVNPHRGEPSSQKIRGFLGGTFRRAGRQPRHLISDQGTQFCAKGFRRWCRRRGIRHRFGAVGKYGSVAVIERCIRTLKTECTRRLILVPFRLAVFRQELALFFSWFNDHRPHTRLTGATPDEVYYHRRPACWSPRFEPRARWPRRSRCAAPQVLVRGQSGVGLEIEVRHHAGRRHLPIIALNRVA